MFLLYVFVVAMLCLMDWVSAFITQRIHLWDLIRYTSTFCLIIRSRLRIVYSFHIGNEREMRKILQYINCRQKIVITNAIFKFTYENWNATSFFYCIFSVENGLQFDAARAFLKELDVTEFVWIGLMRPQNTQHFVWT